MRILIWAAASARDVDLSDWRNLAAMTRVVVNLSSRSSLSPCPSWTLSLSSILIGGEPVALGGGQLATACLISHMGVGGWGMREIR
jgi:hypothetical protein